MTDEADSPCQGEMSRRDKRGRAGAADCAAQNRAGTLEFVGRPLGAAAKMAAIGRRGTIPPVGGKWPEAKGGRDKPPPHIVQ